MRARAGGVAHGLNNILMVISALAEDALVDSAVPDARKEDLRHMLGAGPLIRGRRAAVGQALMNLALTSFVGLKGWRFVLLSCMGAKAL